MAEKLREAAAHGDVDRVARLLNENVKPLPDEVCFFNCQILKVTTHTHIRTRIICLIGLTHLLDIFLCNLCNFTISYDFT